MPLRWPGAQHFALVAAMLLAPMAGAATAAAAGATDVDLALVLAVDASASINAARWDLERQGYAGAFRDPEVLKALQSGPIGAIAVTLVEWSAQFEESQVVPWTVISDAASAQRFSASLADLPRAYNSRTSISWGIMFSASLLDRVPFNATRRVIDVSGDGPENTSSGGPVSGRTDLARLRTARDQVVASGITINGLPIFGDPAVRKIDEYYMTNVIGGSGAFMIVAESFATFASAIKRKLLLEIAERQTSPVLDALALR
jgi:hypothetical protein